MPSNRLLRLLCLPGTPVPSNEVEPGLALAAHAPLALAARDPSDLVA